MNKFPILYSFRRCPYAMRARISIKLCNIKVELREVLLSPPHSEILKISPKGTVPVLLLPNGKVIEESIDIMDWAIKNNTNNKKILNNKNIKPIKSLLNTFDSEFKFNLDRYKYHRRYINENDIKTPEYYRDKCIKNLITIEEILNSKNEWITGKKISYLDIAILPFIRQFRIANMNWFDNELKLNKIKLLLNRFIEWNVFLSIMNKNKLWNISDPAIYFGEDK